LSTIIKPLLALVISIILFAGFAWLADTELLEYVQTRLYNPSILNQYEKENTADAVIAENHIYDLQKRFAAALTDASVRSSFLYNQSADDIFERSRIFGILLETTSGLQSVQFIDSNGTRIHYSTLPRDIISQNINSTSYRNYNEDPLALPYDTVSVSSGGDGKFTMDEQTERLIFSFPFFDSIDVYRGTALFSVSIRALANRLAEEGRLKFNEDVTLIKEPAGLLLGSPVSSKTEIIEKVSAIWNKGILDRVVIDAEESGVKFSLISLKTQNGLFFGRLINDYLFSIPESMKLILKLSIFLTAFLLLYFIFNLKPNAVILVQNRIKRLRDSLFEHLYVNKTAQERSKWILELEQRRDEIRSELKRSLKLKPSLEKTIDGIINKSWDELMFVLKSGTVQYIPVDAQPHIAAPKAEALEDAEELEEVEALEDAEELEEVESLEDAEELEEVESLEDAEELEEIESLEDAEELEEVEALEDAEELEEIESLEDAEELEEVEALEDAEELEEVESLEDAEELEEVESLEDAEELEEETGQDTIPWQGFKVIDDDEDLFEEDEEDEETQKIIDGINVQSIDTEWEDIGEFEDILKKAISDETGGKTKQGSFAKQSSFERQGSLLKKAEKLAAKKKGLLARAEAKEKKQKKRGGLLALVEAKEKKPKKRGLLALAESKERKPKKKGLLALASSYEREETIEAEDEQDLFKDIDIVSPFSSMFSSLEKGENAN